MRQPKELTAAEQIAEWQRSYVGPVKGSATRSAAQSGGQVKPYRCPVCRVGFNGPDLADGLVPRHTCEDGESLCPGSGKPPVRVTAKGRP